MLLHQRPEMRETQPNRSSSNSVCAVWVDVLESARALSGGDGGGGGREGETDLLETNRPALAGMGRLHV